MIQPPVHRPHIVGPRYGADGKGGGKGWQGGGKGWQQPSYRPPSWAYDQETSRPSWQEQQWQEPQPQQQEEKVMAPEPTPPAEESAAPWAVGAKRSRRDSAQARARDLAAQPAVAKTKEPSASEKPQKESSASTTQSSAPSYDAGKAAGTGRTSGPPECMVKMKNFPAAWTSDRAQSKLREKISNLLEKFGQLKEEPLIEGIGGDGPVIATATFDTADAAKAAVSTLHGVDNRTEAEKQRCGRRPATANEKFFVQQAMTSGDSSSGAAKAHGGSPSDKQAKPGRVKLSELPAEWSRTDIMQLCMQYGAVDDVLPGPNGSYYVDFSMPEKAMSAEKALSGLQIQNEGSICTLKCEVMDPNGKAATTKAGQASSAPNGVPDSMDMPPLVFYVDELLRSQAPPTDTDKEIYLIDMPVVDYSEQQLREWLEGFGTIGSLYFLRDLRTAELTGKGYVSFPNHEEAESLVTAFADAEEGNVSGSWSLSEQIIRGASGPLGVEVLPGLQQRIKGVARQLGCSKLVLAGERCEGGPGLEALGLETGPLHFVMRPHMRGPEVEQRLKDGLANILREEVLAKAKPRPRNEDTALYSDADTEPDSDVPCIVVRGFPNTWKEQQVKLIFAVFGGVQQVRFVDDHRGRHCCVELKAPENLEKAVKQLHNTQVGDGELIDECVITCELRGPKLAVTAESSAGPFAIFIDELPMPSRPDVRPGPNECEVFFENLPVGECTEDEILAFLEGFGSVEDVRMLREHGTQNPTGKAYCRFGSHEEAEGCIAENPEGGEEAVARWSESERVGQGADCVYGTDILSAFCMGRGQVLESIRQSAGVKRLWVLGDAQKNKDSDAPEPLGTQLHFRAECETEEQKSQFLNAMSKALQAFHDKVTRKLADKNAKPQGGPPPWGYADPRRPPGPPGGAAPGRPPPPGYFGGPGYPPPPPPPPRGPMPGGGPPPSGWQNGQEPRRPPAGHDPAKKAPAPGPPMGGKGGIPPEIQAGIEKGEKIIKDAKKLSDNRRTQEAYEKYCSGLQFLLEAMPKLGEESPETGKLREKVGIYLEEAERLKSKMAAGTEGGRSKNKRPKPSSAPSQHEAKDDPMMGDPDLQAVIDRGEDLMSEGRLAEGNARLEEAYEKYCKGLQILLQVMPQLDDKDRKASALRRKISSYLEMAEDLKKTLDAGGATSGGRDSGGRDKSPGGRSPIPPKPSDRGSRHHKHRHQGQGDRSRSRDRRRHGGQGGHGGRSRSRSRHRHRHRGDGPRSEGGVSLKPGPGAAPMDDRYDDDYDDRSPQPVRLLGRPAIHKTGMVPVPPSKSRGMPDGPYGPPPVPSKSQNPQNPLLMTKGGGLPGPFPAKTLVSKGGAPAPISKSTMRTRSPDGWD